MLREQVEHVIKKSDPRSNGGFAASVQFNGCGDIGLFCFSFDSGFTQRFIEKEKKNRDAVDVPTGKCAKNGRVSRKRN